MLIRKFSFSNQEEGAPLFSKNAHFVNFKWRRKIHTPHENTIMNDMIIKITGILILNYKKTRFGEEKVFPKT